MLALFNADDLLAQHCGQLALDDLLVRSEMLTPSVSVEAPVMPASWELLPREEIIGQGVLGA